MIFWGISRTGKKLFLGEPVEASIACDRDAPADLLRARFPAEDMWEELRDVVGYEKGSAVFRGIVDEQDTFLSGEGLTVELTARSLEALLLDNEAQPGTIQSPSLARIEERFLKPLGLSLGEGDRGAKRGSLTISKGDSCWTVLSGFCREFLGAEPWVGLDGKVNVGEEGTTLELDGVISAQVSLLPYKRISQVWLQSCRGSYDTLYRDESANVVRTRYLSLESGKRPKEILSRGEQDSFLITVTCAGPWRPVKRARASVFLPKVGRFENCPVRSALYRLDKSGERVKLVLERPEDEGGEEQSCG